MSKTAVRRQTNRQSIRELRAQCARLHAALVALVGVDDAAGWDRLELSIRLAPSSQVGDRERALLAAVVVLREIALTEGNDDEDEDAQYYWSRW